MIKNLYPTFKKFGSTAGLNINTKGDITLKSEVTEIIYDVLDNCVIIEEMIKKSEFLKRDYREETR